MTTLTLPPPLISALPSSFCPMIFSFLRWTCFVGEEKSIQLALAAEPRTNQMQGTKVTRSMCTTEWTDEKHSQYLKSMEASFVNQLYNSKEMLRLSACRRANISDRKLLTVFNSETDRANDRCEDMKSNRYIWHLRTSTKHRPLTSPVLQNRSTCTSRAVDSGARKGISSASESEIIPKRFQFYEYQISQQDMFYSDTEISDQNFEDEVAEGEGENNQSNTKRMKSSMSSGDEQIVPVSKSSTSRDGGGGGGSSKN